MKWSDITIDKWQHILAISKTELPDFSKEIELVCYLYNLDGAEVLNYPLEKFKALSSQLDFLQDVYEGDMKTSFIINDVKYVVNWEMQKRTAGQFIDLSELTKDQDLINDNLHKILAVICIEEGSKYDGNINERAEVFKNHLTMDIVYPIAGFFLTVLKASLPTIQDYLEKDITKQKKELLQMIKDSMSIGDGTVHLTN